MLFFFRFCEVLCCNNFCGDPVNIERNSTEVCLTSAFQRFNNLMGELFLLLLLSVHLLGAAPGSFLFSSIGSSRWLQPKNLLGVLLACQKLTGSCWGLSLPSPSVQQLGLEQLSVPPPPPPPTPFHPPHPPIPERCRPFAGSFWKA